MSSCPLRSTTVKGKQFEWFLGGKYQTQVGINNIELNYWKRQDPKQNI